MHPTYPVLLSALVAMLLASGSLLAGSPDDTLFDNGFELENLYIDVAATPSAVCVVDTGGNLRCAAAPDVDIFPEFLRGGYIDLAATAFGVCARAEDGAIDCFGEPPLEPDAAFESAISGTTGFLPDLPDSLCAPDAAATTIVCFGEAPPSGVDVLDVAAADPTGDADVFCWAPVAGGIECTLNGSPVAVGTGQVFSDIAVGGRLGFESVCGLTGPGDPACFDLNTAAPDPIRGPAPGPLRALFGNEAGSYCGLDADDQMVCWLNESVAVTGNSIGQNRASSSDLASIESFFSTSVGCGIDRAQKIDCWGALFAGAGLPPPGGGWTGVESTGGGTAWSNPSRPGWVAGFSADQQRAATDFEPAEFPFLERGLSVCGLRNGEFRCVEGTDRWRVPEGPWRDVAVTFGDAAGWCGVRDSGLLECESRIAGSQLSTVPVGNYVQVSLSYAWFSPNPEERAVALGEDGSLVCWSTSGACAVPSGNDFVQLSDFSATSQFALRANGDIVNVETGAVEAGEVFDRYRGSIGFRSDGTIGWWNDPGRPVPPGAYLDVVPTFTVTLGPGSELTPVDACGVRADGGFDCWVENAGVADIVFSTAGSYRQIHAATGIQLTDSAGNNQTFMLRDFGNALKPAVELATSFTNQCMIDSDGRLGCKGVNANDSSPVNQTTGAYRGLAMDNEIVCAIDAVDRVECWSFGTGTLPVFPDEPFSRVVAGSGHACAISLDGAGVVCAGNNPFHALPADPFPTLTGGQYRDLATSAFKTCAILPDGTVDCFEAFNADTAPPPSAAGYRQIVMSDFSQQACLIDNNDRLECFRSFGNTVWPSFFAPDGAYQDVAISDSAICALTTGGTPRCWGVEATLAEWNLDGPRL